MADVPEAYALGVEAQGTMVQLSQLESLPQEKREHPGGGGVLRAWSKSFHLGPCTLAMMWA